jgi:RecB family exonuclease
MSPPRVYFARYRDIAADVAAAIGEGAVQAIVASRGMADAITSEALRNSPGGAVSLRLPTIESFARSIVNDAGEYPRVATDLEQRLAMRTAARLAADRIIDSHALGAMLQRSYRDVRDSGLTLDDFEARIGGMRNRRRAEAMLRAWTEYERLIAASGAVDPADVLLRAADLVAAGAPCIVAGFYDMTGAQLRIVHALATAGRLAAIHVPVAEDESFASRFVAQLPACEAAVSDPAIHIRQAAVAISQYENKTVELREICRQAGALEGSVAIVARSLEPYDIRLIKRFAAEYGFGVTAAESVSLSGQRIGRAIANLLRLRDRNFPRTAVIDLLRDGFMVSRTIDIDFIDDATRNARIAGGTGDAIRSVAGYAEAVAEIEALAPVAALTGRAWADLLRNIAAHFRLETAQDVAAVDAVESIASVLARAQSWNRRFEGDAVIDLVEQSSLAVDDAAGRVWAGDAMRFRGRTFDHVFVARMQDDILPQRRTSDPLLPDSDRAAIGIREIGDGLDEERLLLRLLQDGARSSLHFTLAGTDGLGKLLRPSPFLKQLAIEREPERRAAILRDFGAVFARRPEEQPRRSGGSVRQLQRLAFAGSESPFDGYLELDEPIRARIGAALATLSPTAMEDFGECPQKFLWKRLLGVRDLEEPELELHVNARDKGRLDHTILERFYRSLKESDITTAATLRGDLRERLDALVDEEFDIFEAKIPPFNAAMRGIERRATKRNLHTFVVSDLADLHASGLRPKEFEFAFGKRSPTHPDPFIVKARDIEMTVEGRIDRIDGNGDRLRVIDYKGGKAMRHQDLAKKIDRGVRMQLAMYAMAVAEFFGREDESVSGAIKPLRGGKDAKFAFDLAAHAPRLRETLDVFAAAILAGRFPAFPNEKDTEFDSCGYCPVNHSCRTRHDEAEKYAVMQFEDARTLLSR